ncbi:unnamed protein product [Ceutorhynchus assimilis]|uniref:DUF4455 domain-containing protein n=1 Tax=Ceutorhynchus assimilis TaxID=467358 RepID=A0A9P0DIA7_9CUCU|nr:unnamed protein product [Ceutorhynchus assimilis]
MMDDDFDLKCLPTDFVGTSKPSKRLEAFYKKQEEKHEKIIQDLHARKYDICKKFERLFEKLADQLKGNLEDFKRLIKDELFEARIKSNQDNANSMEKNDFEKMYSTILHYTNKMHKLTEEFYENLVKIEKDKSKGFTNILKDAYEQLKHNSYKLPNQTDELIELEIENINQTILCNNRSYLALKTQLQAEIQNFNKNAIQDLQQVRQCWVKFIRGQVEKSLGTLKTQYSPDFLKTMEQLKEKTKEAGARLSHVINTQDANRWLSNVQHALAQLDHKAKKITTNYKQATVLIYHRCFQELKTVEDAMAQLAKPEPFSKEQIEMYSPNLEEITKMYDAELETIQKIWNNLINEMTKAVDYTYKFLIAGSVLWKTHFWRTEILQMIMLKDMENTVHEHDAISEASETKLNVLIDTLRQEPGKEKLKKTFEDVKKMFYVLDNSYKAQHQIEIALMRKYKHVQELKVDVLVTEVKRFLNFYPPDPEIDPKIQRKRASQTSIAPMDDTENLISTQMLYCTFQIKAISNWQFGLWESISSYLDLARTEILEETEKWIEGHLKRADKRLEIRLGVNRTRLKKIEVYIYEERLEELCLHQSRFDEHKIAVERDLEKLKYEFKKDQFEFETNVDAYKNEIAALKTKSVSSENSSAIAGIMQILNARTVFILGEIDNFILENLNKYDNFFSSVKASHVLFLKNIKLFSEYGNYSITEIKDLLKNMEKVENQVEKVLNDIRKDAASHKQKLIENVQEKKAEVTCTLNGIDNEHKFMENIKKKLNNLEKQLIKEVYMFQRKFQSLTDQFDKSEEQITKNCGDFNYYKDFSEQLKDMSQKIIEITEYLDDPFPIRIYSDKSNVDIEPEAATAENYKAVDELTMKLFNVKIPLYNNDYNEEKYYFLKLNKLIRDYWNDIIAYGMEFYADHSRGFYLDDEMIEPGLVKLMQGLYKKFSNIQSQCEMRTLQDTKEFISFAARCVYVLQDCIETYIDEYARKALKNFDDFYEIEIQRDMRKRKKCVQQKYEELNKKLKPLHGHPTNKKLLENLQIEAEIIYSEAKELFEDIKEPYLEKLNDQFGKAVDDFFALKDIIPPIIRLINDVRNVIEDLVLKLNEKVQLIRMLIEFGSHDKSAQQNIIAHCKSFLLVYDAKSFSKTDTNVLSNELIDCSYSHSLFTMEESFSAKSPPPSLTPTPGLSGCVSGCVSDSFSNSEDMDLFSIDIRDAYNKYSNEVQNENFDEMLQVLRIQWQEAVTKVMNLYTVKYDNRK